MKKSWCDSADAPGEAPDAGPRKSREREGRTVTWRRAIAAAVAAAFCLVALVVVFRSDGLPAVDAASSRATRWFVHQPSGKVILADG